MQVGVPSQAFNLTWRPTEETPDIVFYQSTARPRQGWMLVKLGSAVAERIIENSKSGGGVPLHHPHTKLELL
jgi:hypothetical protein